MLFLFLDGVGLGEADPSINPFAAFDLPALERLAGGYQWTLEAQAIDRDDHVFHGIDARLGVEGLPQSGTGQASLFTGVNCADLAGRHYGPYPHSKTREAIKKHNLFARIQRLDLGVDEPCAFANAYPPRFFSYARQTDRWTVTTRCCLDAGVRIRTLEDVQTGQALSADLTGEAWRERLDLPVGLIDPKEAGRRLLSITRNHACTLFEYFLTDKAGHSRSFERAESALQVLHRCLEGLLSDFDPTSDTLLITSDHGNLEDLSTKTHTRFDVPLIAYGRLAACFSDAASLLDVTPALVEAVRLRQGRH